jgi:hypothetical protein
VPDRYTIRLEGRTFDPTGIRSIEAVAAEFPGDDRLDIVVEMRNVPDRTVTLATRIDATNRTLLDALKRTITAHTRPR